MRIEDYKLMHALEADFWWFVGMRKVTEALVRRYASGVSKAVLDMGCGTGINLLWAAELFQSGRVVGCDYSATALSWCVETLKSAASDSGRVEPRLSQGDVRHLPFETGSFDLVTNLDVLDTFASPGEDLQAMSEFFRVLRPGGVAFVRVPAYQWLMSSHDLLFETQHRYSVPELRAKMSGVGFVVIEATYANTLLFPIALLRRTLRKVAGIADDKTDAQPWPRFLKWLNGPFRFCLQLEAMWLAKGGTLPFGLSAICLGRKPDC
jgi:ubiquinone/menaquinone biosynthesis C-methylase UbiE